MAVAASVDLPVHWRFAVQPDGTGKLKITGDLTLHGVTKEVVLDVEGPSAVMKDPMGNLRMGASATTRISRKDFGMNTMPGMIGDEISIVLDVELIQPPAQTNPPNPTAAK